MATQVAKRGFEVHRHSGVRRQAMLARERVDLVIDVGAADGGYGRSLRSFGYEGAIVSYEPLAAAYSRLGTAIADDPGWSAHNLALGAEPGEATINVASNSNSSSLLPMRDEHLAAAPHVTYVAEERITVARLDDVAGGLPGERPFLKIDTQGFEREVLAGGSQTVARCVGLELELSLAPLYDGGMLIDEALTWAYSQGFRLVVLEQGYAAPTGEILQVDGVFVRPPR